MNTEPYIVSVDWFQVTCSRNPEQKLEIGYFLVGTNVPDYDKKAVYELARAKEFNPIYDNSLAVLFHGFQLATIYFNPRPSTLSKSLCSIKLSNRILYSGNWAFYLVDIARALKWQVKNIGRVDVCADFKSFSGGLSPYEFIRRYLHSTVGTADDAPSYVRVGSNKYVTQGRKKVTFVGKSNVSAHENDYLRFGSRSTGVSVYLYCKSTELREVHDKPYITDMWIAGGLITKEDIEQLDTEQHSTIPIFRLEISINSSGLNIKRQRTAEGKTEVRTAIAMLSRNVKPLQVESLAVSDFLTQSSIENLFFAYANKYFQFKRVGKSKYRQYWESVPLFDVKFEPTIKPYTISRSFGTGVSERNAVSTIKRLMQSIHDLSMPEMVSLNQAANILTRYARLGATEIDRSIVESVAMHLRMGHTFDELPKMAVCSVVHLESIKRIVYESVYHEIRDILTDSDVARAVDQLEAERALIREQSQILSEWEQSSNIQYTISK